jgi:hypothetical protein
MIDVVLCEDAGDFAGRILATVPLPAVPAVGDEILVGEDAPTHYVRRPGPAVFTAGTTTVAIRAIPAA